MKSVNDMNLEQCLSSCNTPKQYESLSKNSQSNDGWIEWNGGECPVPKGTLVDLRYRQKNYADSIGVPALEFGKRSEEDFWRHDYNGLDIIAWRLHQPDQQAWNAEWNGEGLPTVGCECEFYKHFPERKILWIAVKIMYLSEFTVVMKELNGEPGEIIHHPRTLKFRPIQTEADRKREDARNAIAELWRSSLSSWHTAELIYDAIAAGKIPGLKLED